MTVSNTMRNGGFSLVEVLISALVLSIGLLGLAGLQMAGIRSNHSAFYRSQATILAYEIADRMRANPLQVRAEAYDVQSIAHPYTKGEGQVKADLDQWKAALDILPSFDGSIDCEPDGDCLIVVQWDDTRPERKTIKEDGDDTVVETLRDKSKIGNFQMRTRI